MYLSRQDAVTQSRFDGQLPPWMQRRVSAHKAAAAIANAARLPLLVLGTRPGPDQQLRARQLLAWLRCRRAVEAPPVDEGFVDDREVWLRDGDLVQLQCLRKV